MANEFLNNVEIAEQEAAYMVLKLPFHQSSRATIFIPTSPSSERVSLLKSMSELVELAAEKPLDKDVTVTGVIKRSEFQFASSACSA